MDASQVHTIAVCGAGTMGSGIAQVCAVTGYKTILFDPDEQVLEKARSSISHSLAILESKNKISPEIKDSALANLAYVHSVKDCRADLVIEAIIEKESAKISLFNELSGINGETTILASNTSSLSLTSIAEHLPRPQYFAGLHFFNPAPLMKLVEVVRTAKTDEQVITTLVELVGKMGKTAVTCSDSPGFIVNRVARPFYIESLRLVELGVASAPEIDALLEAAGFKMGPFKLMDLIGNDINYAVSQSVYEQLGKPGRLKPSPIQEEKVKEGKLGRKTGEGYYKYS